MIFVDAKGRKKDPGKEKEKKKTNKQKGQPLMGGLIDSGCTSLASTG
jgi:hypothetical protein